jgi:hypothetical protein
MAQCHVSRAKPCIWKHLPKHFQKAGTWPHPTQILYTLHTPNVLTSQQTAVMKVTKDYLHNMFLHNSCNVF